MHVRQKVYQPHDRDSPLKKDLRRKPRDACPESGKKLEESSFLWNKVTDGAAPIVRSATTSHDGNPITSEVDRSCKAPGGGVTGEETGGTEHSVHPRRHLPGNRFAMLRVEGRGVRDQPDFSIHSFAIRAECLAEVG